MRPGEMPNGNLLVSVDKIGESTVEDHILEVTPGSIVQVWDMRPILTWTDSDLVETRLTGSIIMPCITAKPMIVYWSQAGTGGGQ